MVRIAPHPFFPVVYAVCMVAHPKNDVRSKYYQCCAPCRKGASTGRRPCSACMCGAGHTFRPPNSTSSCSKQPRLARARVRSRYSLSTPSRIKRRQSSSSKETIQDRVAHVNAHRAAGYCHGVVAQAWACGSRVGVCGRTGRGAACVLRRPCLRDPRLGGTEPGEYFDPSVPLVNCADDPRTFQWHGFTMTGGKGPASTSMRVITLLPGRQQPSFEHLRYAQPC